MQAAGYNRGEQRYESSGVLCQPGESTLKVSVGTGTLGTNNGAVDVATGTALVDGDEVSAGGVSLDVPTGMNYPRKDAVVVDPDASGGVRVVIGETTPTQYPSGVGESGDLFDAIRPPPPTPTGPVLAKIAVPAGASSIADDNLRDARACLVRPRADAHRTQTRVPMVGDSLGAQADVLCYLTDSGATLRVVRADQGLVADTAAIGAGIQTALEAADAIAVNRTNASGDVGQASLRIAPGEYDAQDVSRIDCPKGGTDAHTVVTGYGARLNQTLGVINDKQSIHGLTVHGTPSGPGFFWISGQLGRYSHLTAENCTTYGFRLGTDGGTSQVAWTTFDSLKAIGNGSGGVAMFGTGDPSWVNANIFTGLVSRHNAGNGVEMLGTTNYNMFIGPHCEGNTDPDSAIYIRDGGENAVFGGQTASDGDSEYGSVDMENNNGGRGVVLGGRHHNGVRAAGTWREGPTGDFSTQQNISAPRVEARNDGIDADKLVVAPQSAEPADPEADEIYLDDGTNTSDGTRGLRQWDGSAWVDI